MENESTLDNIVVQNFLDESDYLSNKNLIISLKKSLHNDAFISKLNHSIDQLIEKENWDVFDSGKFNFTNKKHIEAEGHFGSQEVEADE